MNPQTPWVLCRHGRTRYIFGRPASGRMVRRRGWPSARPGPPGRAPRPAPASVARMTAPGLVGEGGGGPQPAVPGQRGGDEVRYVGAGDLPAAGRRVVRADPVLPGAGAVDQPGRPHQGPVEARLPHDVL